MLKLTKYLLPLFYFSLTAIAQADTIVPMYMTAEKGHGKSIGVVIISENKYGLLFTPKLRDLKPEIHGFHIHVNPSCEQNGMAAGGHLDPQKTGKHLGPYDNHGHLGDLPAVTVKADGTATLPVLAPRLMHVSEIKNHVLMIHEGGDNYSDVPEKLGGGGGRMACGLIK